ncbi:TraR/DksA C4-type zinc finger protein [Paraburkholderia sp. BR14263]|uniref:TraR/DksA C4-type zinc finger protein n=1 Tax=unclassified Paraburkholderia TaxID=2615204 RepID=UPI0034CED230
MDDLDHASDIEEQFRALAIAAIARPVADAPVDGPTHCVNESCGVEIPEARRKAAPGCRFCIECQTRRETRLRMGYAIHA